MREKYGYPIIITVLSFITRFSFLNFPNQVVFDETHYGKFVSNYLNHFYFFDLHPPFLKLLATLSAYWGHFNPNFDFASIGETFTEPNFIYLRIVPAIAGFLLPLVIYFLAKQIGISTIGAFFTGIAVVFENSILVQSKFLLIDGVLLFFGFSAILFYLLYRNKKSLKWLILSAFFLGATISIKWTGISFLATCILIEILSFIHNKKQFQLKTLAILIFIPVLFYITSFAIHFHILTKSGTGDAFMSQNFLQKGFTEKFIELNAIMLIESQNLTTSHPYTSKWYTWPLMKRPIFYWQNTDQRIYSNGNPFIYWFGALAILILLMHIIFRTRFFIQKRKAVIFIIFSYSINFFPYAILTRITFIYYYLASLVFSILAISLIIDSIKNKKVKNSYYIILLIIFIITFLYFSPLTYGFPMSPESQNNHLWFSTWR
ncbi:MAG: phospholipid carrier-dependent glycosyltransferase [Patescibacteria group bacterium]|nr:phospholipid carrier-dependent glycosyltransferase [Patescibacteria group bacterium]